MEAAMPCKKGTKKHLGLQETVARSDEFNKIQKTKHACIVEAHESKRKRLESTLHQNHENHIAERGFNSISHCNVVHKFVAVRQAMRIPDAKAAVGKVASVATGQCKEQEGGHSGSTKREKKKVHFGTLMDTCHFTNAVLVPKYQKYKGRVVL